MLKKYGGWSTEGKTAFANWVDTVYIAKVANYIKNHENNWGDWGTYGAMAAYYYRDDTVNLNNEITRLNGKIDKSIAADGSMPKETARGDGGLRYTYFALAPMTAAAHIAKEATGTDLFQWTSPSGRTLKSALDYLLYYLKNPGQWPHYTNPGVPDTTAMWSYDLFEAMSSYYDDPDYESYAAERRSIIYVGHHYAWSFPTITKVGIKLVDENFLIPIQPEARLAAGRFRTLQIPALPYLTFPVRPINA
nr:alginate lyase family protein [Paenibacillus swuensis]